MLEKKRRIQIAHKTCSSSATAQVSETRACASCVSCKLRDSQLPTLFKIRPRSTRQHTAVPRVEQKPTLSSATQPAEKLQFPRCAVDSSFATRFGRVCNFKHCETLVAHSCTQLSKYRQLSSLSAILVNGLPLRLRSPIMRSYEAFRDYSRSVSQSTFYMRCASGAQDKATGTGCYHELDVDPVFCPIMTPRIGHPDSPDREGSRKKYEGPLQSRCHHASLFVGPFQHDQQRSAEAIGSGS